MPTRLAALVSALPRNAVFFTAFSQTNVARVLGEYGTRRVDWTLLFSRRRSEEGSPLTGTTTTRRCAKAALDDSYAPPGTMSGDRFDYRSERQRHEKFVGRAALLARLDQLLVDSETDRWVVITGGPGMGKSALLAAWLARREALGVVVPHHFIRRGAYDWDDPAKLVGSLVAQIEDGFPELREPDGDERMHPATRLSRALSRVSEGKLRTRGDRLVVLIDGLDEYDPPAGSIAGDPLAAFLPDVLPAGVRLLCASRPRHPYVSSLEARDGELVQIDLDGPDNAADNNATVRAYWEGAAELLGLTSSFVDEAVSRAGGNVQHAVQLRKHLIVLSPERRQVEDIPRGLAALIEKSWERIAVEPVVVDGLGILCAAREALTLDELSAVAGWAGDAQRRAFVHAAKELLVETLRLDGQPEYRLHHDAIRGHIAKALGPVALRRHHATLARQHATWPTSRDGAARRYALRHAMIHRAEAGDWADAWRIGSDMSFLEAKCREFGAHDVEVDVTRIAERCRTAGNLTIGHRFSDLTRALVRESHWLHAAPEATAAVVWNRLRRSGWSEHDLGRQLRIPATNRFLRVQHTTTRESPTLIRDLAGHWTNVSSCAVTLDGRHVISGAHDQTLKVWDLETGRERAALEGHTDAVSACAVTPDGRRIVSASYDRTLRVWDLGTGRKLSTLRGHACEVTACIVTPDGRRVISASYDMTLKVWDLESGSLITTLQGHASAVTACAVTLDGRHLVSASYDRTLKVWDLENACARATLEGHTGWVIACAVTLDNQRVVSASWDRTLKLWDLESGQPLATLEGHTDRASACAVAPDGRRVVSASHDKTLKIWDLESKRVLATLDGHASAVTACTVTADGRHIISASYDGLLKVWDLESKRQLSAPNGHGGAIRACSVTVDGKRAISASDDRAMKIWDLESGRVLATLEGHVGGVSTCAVMADGRRVISASWDRTLKVWDLESRRVLTTLEGRAGWVTACAVTADGRWMVSASGSRTLKIWNLEDGRAFITLQGHAGRVITCAVTADGQYVVSGSEDRTLKIWHLESGRELATLEGHTSGVTACAVTANGLHAVSGSDDGVLKLWDLERRCVLVTMYGHSDTVSACAMTADGRGVVSASYDRTLKVWDPETFACLFTHRGDSPYSAVATSGTAIIAGDRAGTLWFLDWPPSTRNSSSHRASGGDNTPRRSHPARVPPSPRPKMKKHTILFLAANPLGTDRLALDQEARAIQVELEQSGYRDRFELVTRWAAQPLDLLRELRRLRPTVVHFSGHGGHGKPGEPRADAARHRDVVADPGALDGEHRHGLFFQGSDGRPQLVSTAALQETFGAAGASVKLVVLNACYSEAQAEALLAHVDCVVGMGGSINDDAARNFAIGFYGGLGERESVAAAYKQGRAAISLEGLRDSDRPQLKVRDGVDASQLILAADPS